MDHPGRKGSGKGTDVEMLRQVPLCKGVGAALGPPPAQLLPGNLSLSGLSARPEFITILMPGAARALLGFLGEEEDESPGTAGV